MTEHQAAYSTPVYPSIGVITNSPAPCASCGGAMAPDLVFDDLLQCTACGCRRSVRQTPAAAASGRDAAIRELFEMVLGDHEAMGIMYASIFGCDADEARADLEEERADYRRQLAALLGEG